MWVPSHIGIHGNEITDRLAKATSNTISPNLFNYHGPTCPLCVHFLLTKVNNELFSHPMFVLNHSIVFLYLCDCIIVELS